MLRQPKNDPGIGEQLPDVAFGHGRMKIVEPVGFLHQHDLRLQARESRSIRAIRSAMTLQLHRQSLFSVVTFPDMKR